jgi:hypothetical protein
MSDLRQQGIDRGFEESDAQYQRGERAKGRAKDAQSQLGSEQQRFEDSQRGYRNEIGAGEADRMGIDIGTATNQRDYEDNLGDIGQSNVYNRTGRQAAAENDVYGTRTGVQAGKISAANANSANNAQILSGFLGAAGTVGGAVAGGPAGAKAGGAAGNAAGQATQAPSQGNYQYNPYPAAQQAGPYNGLQAGGADPYGGSSYSPYGGRAYQPSQLRQGAMY